MTEAEHNIAKRWAQFITDPENAAALRGLMESPVFSRARALVLEQLVAPISLSSFRGQNVEEELKQVGVRSVYMAGVLGAFTSLDNLATGNNPEHGLEQQSDLPMFDYEQQTDMTQNERTI